MSPALTLVIVIVSAEIVGYGLLWIMFKRWEIKQWKKENEQ